MTTLAERIEYKRKQVEAAKVQWKTLNEELRAMQIQAIEESDEPIWERFLQWARDGVATYESDYLENFYVDLDTPAGFPDKADLAESLRGTYSYNDEDQSYAIFGYDDIGRGVTIDMADVITDQWDHWRQKLIDGESKLYWLVSMDIVGRMALEKKRGKRLTPEESTHRIPLALEHFDQLAEQVMKANLKSYCFDW